MIVEQFISYKDKDYLVRADCYYIYIDDSFDHEFGTHECGHYELEDCDIFECIDENGNDILPDKELTSFIKECFEISDYDF
jgi:hypothetical protein